MLRDGITFSMMDLKFQKKSFPLFDALGELYDGHIAQGT
jgi:hypothetical protein